jgi:HAD superfamily hydrolase (TIGR01509 family)
MSLVIFDCDGVLVESESIYIATELELLADYGVEYDRELYIRRCMGLSAVAFRAVISSTMLEADPANAKNVSIYFDRLRDETERRFREELVEVSGAKRAIESMSAPVCVASSSSPTQIDWKLSHTGLIELFRPHLFSTERVANGKPAPDLFLLAAKEMGVQPEDCVVIEDSSNGVVAARRAGMKVVGLTAGSHCGVDHHETLLASGADMIVDNYKALPTAFETLRAR